ncbi:MAG: gamma-glutamyl-gamma-aminobutyrate hydrolase family protein, partial [Bdellovibrionales bacterium]|nr:gamma-glutamyl-gamma-aminobutyrate hydrolase family protein [Bdellovibrionales bacterium]
LARGSQYESGMRPLIGISANFFHPEPHRRLFKNKRLAYFEQQLGEYFIRAGADVVGIVHPVELSGLETLVPRLDGIVLAGGADVSPQQYGEEPIVPEWGGDPYHDAYELELLRLAEKHQLPVLGVCRGCQILNVYAGGSLYQDLHHFEVAKGPHRDQELYDALMHTVHLESGTLLESIFGTETGKVVSVHHQAVKQLGKGLRVAARSEEGIIEAIESVEVDRFVVGVQWHPEWAKEDEPSMLDPRSLVRAFVGAALKRADLSRT